MIVVIDYNVGNIKSVCNAFGHIGCEVKLSRESQVIEDASGLVLPGVAAFGYAVNALGASSKLIKEVALSGKPLLGICVGYQMLFNQSSEYGPHNGLGLVRGRIVPVPPGRKIPHMGWNLVKLPEDMDLFDGLAKEKHFYFAHSFYADVADSQAKVAYTDYGFNLPVKATRRCRILIQRGGSRQISGCCQRGSYKGSFKNEETSTYGKIQQASLR